MKKILLAMILIICLIGSVSASENITDIESSDETTEIIDENEPLQDDGPKIYVNSSHETSGDGSSWDEAVNGSTSWIEEYIHKFGYNNINNGTVYLADGYYEQNNNIAWNNCTFIGQGTNTVISFFGGGSDFEVNFNLNLKFINLTFIRSPYLECELNDNYHFINCTFIDFPIKLITNYHDIRPKYVVYDIYFTIFENCQFINYTGETLINAYEKSYIKFINCTFKNISGDSIIDSYAEGTDNSGDVPGAYIYNSTFRDCIVKGIVKVRSNSQYCIISNCDYDFDVNPDWTGATPIYLNTTDKAIIKTNLQLSSSGNNVVITLTDEENTPLADMEIVVNGSYHLTDNNGQVILTNLKNSFKIDVFYPGNPYLGYTNASESKTFDFSKPTSVPTTENTKKTVKKTSKITAKKATFKKSKKIKKYTITLKSGKNPIKKVKVSLKVKGKTYKATTNAKGKAIFKITKLTRKGTFTAKITFKGNTIYKSTTKSIKIKIK